MNPEYSVVDVHYNIRISNKLAPFEKKVIKLRNQGLTYVKMDEIITPNEYNGTVASLRMFIKKEKSKMPL